MKYIDFVPIAPPPTRKIEIRQLGIGRVVRVRTDKNQGVWKSPEKKAFAPLNWTRAKIFRRVI